MSSYRNKSKTKQIATRELGNISGSLRKGCYYACKVRSVVPLTIVQVNKTNACVHVCCLEDGKKVSRNLYVRVTNIPGPIEGMTTHTFNPKCFELTWGSKVNRIVTALLIEPSTALRYQPYKLPSWY